MQYKSIKGFTGFGQLGVLFVFLGLGFILTGLVQFGIVYSLLPGGASSEKMPAIIEALMLDPENIGALRLSQVLGTLCFFFIPAILYSVVTNGKNMFWLGFNKYFNVLQIAFAFGIIYAANICAGPLADWTKSFVSHYPEIDKLAKKLEDAYNQQVLAMTNLRSWSEYLVAIVIMAFFPAMFEEVFFRGALQNLLVKWWRMPLFAIIITSVIFSIIHMSIYLFLPRVILGFALGLLYHKGKNIWINIIAHFLNNAIAVSTLFYLSRKNMAPDISKLDPKVPWFFGLLGLVAMIVLFIMFDRISAGKVAKINAKEARLLDSNNQADGFNSRNGFRGFGDVDENLN